MFQVNVMLAACVSINVVWIMAKSVSYQYVDHESPDYHMIFSESRLRDDILGPGPGQVGYPIGELPVVSW